MWIETSASQLATCPASNSFASNGECGLKPRPHNFCRNPSSNSFASNGECGLKPVVPPVPEVPPENSFASNGECGLKLPGVPADDPDWREFIRQQWRMWIETFSTDQCKQNSEKFIRQQWRMWIETDWSSVAARSMLIHSPAMANVD